MTRLPRTGAAVAIAAALLLVAGCATQEPAPPPTSSPAPESPAATGAPQPEESETSAPAADPECDTIISETTVADFQSLSWEPVVEEFRVGATVLEGGIQCKWGDPTGAGGDQAQMFGWAPIDAAGADQAQSTLVAEGWVLESDGEGVYVTEDPEIAMAPDENGYGMTYLFGDGWVKVADTKQGLLLVEWVG